MFANVLLADEINRTPPKTQAALLEAMQERRVTVQGRTYDLEPPFFVFATQNPIELEGTYPLPEAQLDRFMFEIVLDYLPEEEEVDVVRSTTTMPPEAVKPVVSREEILAFQRVVRRVPVADEVTRYAVRLVRLSRPVEHGAPHVHQGVGVVRRERARRAGARARRQGARAAAGAHARHVRRRARARAPRAASSHPAQLPGAVGEGDDRVAHREAARRRAHAALRALIVPAAPASFLDPALLARISDLALLARTVVDGFMHGQHRSMRRGSSTDFAQHRAYQPGDDLRRIDWRLLGRTDRFYMKEFEADTNASVMFALDSSASMDYGSGRHEVRLRALPHRVARVAVAAAGRSRRSRRPSPATSWTSCRRRRDICSCCCTRSAARRRRAPARSRRRSQRLAHMTSRAGILVLVTDCYESPDDLGRAADALRMRGQDLIVFHVVDAAERDFPFTAATTFEDSEIEDARRRCGRTSCASATSSRRARITPRWRKRLVGAGADYVRVDTDQPLDRALHAYLDRRLARSRVR